MPLESPRPRVLIGNLEPMARLGMTRVLAEDGLEVLAEEGHPDPAEIVERAKRLRPDSVVLDLDDGDSYALGEAVREAAPETKVILWARDETEMEVLDPGSTTRRRIRTAVSDALLNELSAQQASGERT